MWRRHTLSALAVAIIAWGISPLLASEHQQSKILLNCPNDINLRIIKPLQRDSFARPANFKGGEELTLDGIIEVSSDITTNQIWTANNIYHIVNDIGVQALLVIEPGTIIKFAPDTTMYVNNEGTLISAGTPDNPIIYTSDSADPWYGDYYCPIYIEGNASPSTKVTYSFIEYAYVGIIVLNNQLDYPIENNYLYNNAYGIVEFGTEHTDILNNLLFASCYNAIEVYLESESGQTDANSHILIENNTCDYYQDVGIRVHGVDNEANAGLVVLVNNIVSESYLYGLSLVDNYMLATIANTGYYGNAANKNWAFDEDNQVIETEFPYVEGTGDLPVCYLDQDCSFINSGYEYIEQTTLIGKTTDVNSFPDSNYIDLGFHYPNWNFSNAGDGNILSTDLSQDMIVDFKDFALLAAGWQTTYDINDLNTMADEWLKVASAHPPIAVTISGDTNNLTDDVNIGVIGYGVTTEHVFVLIDGEYKDELEYFDSNAPLLFESDNDRNGGHSIKLVAIDINGLVTVSDTLETDFNNTFFNIIASDYFHPTADYKILGFHNGAGSFEAKVTDYDDQTIWSNTYSGLSVNVVIPGTAFGNEQLCESSITEMGSGLIATAGGSGVTKKGLAKKFKREDCPSGVRMVIVLPNKDVFKARIPAILECARACDQRNVSWVSLYHHDVIEDNIRFLYNKSSVKYVYWCGHANSHVGAEPDKEGANQFYRVIEDPTIHGVGGVARTHTECWRYEPSWWHFNWQKIGVFSWTGGLPDDWDTRGFSLWSLGMYDEGNKKIVFVDGCWSAFFNDMAEAYGMYSLWNAGNHDQIYIGWRCLVLTAAPGSVFDWVLWSTNGVKLFWERMGLGDDVYEALYYTASSGGGGVQTTLWGPNGMMDFDESYEDSDDNIWIYGEGIGAELEP